MSPKSSRRIGTSIITPLIPFPRADVRINISSLCHLNRSNKKKEKKRNGRLPSFPPINLIHLALLVPLEKKSKDQGSYGWQTS